METQPGAKNVHVEKIHLDGLKRSSPTFVTAQLRQLFEARNSRALLTSLQSTSSRLLNLDMFRVVDLRVDRGTSQIDTGTSSVPYEVTATVEEHTEPRPWLRAGCHHGNRVLLGAGVLHGNLLGRGERCEVECGLGVKEPMSCRVSLTKPWTNNSAVRWVLGGWVLGARQLRDDVVCAGVSIRTGAGLHTFRWEGQRRSTTADAPVDVEDPGVEGVVDQDPHREHRSVLRHVFHLDSRDNHIFPSTGSYFHLNQALVGAPDSGHLVQRVDYRRYTTLPWAGMVACVGFVGGLLSDFGNKVSPLDQLTPCQNQHQAGTTTCPTPPPLTDGLSLAQGSVHLFYPVFNPSTRLLAFATADVPPRSPEDTSVCVGLGAVSRIHSVARLEGKFVLPLSGPRAPGVQFGFVFDCR